ncbi:MAG TPA: hypothetical protein VNM22_14880 [Candidatus Limnocylindrales bacterium]|nr:hypothetical protein [Candidatus Limnocylindrales bacterium]
MVLGFQFIVCTALIFFSGVKLSKYGDIIAEKTGLGRTWIGVMLLASVTSLPELITGISSAAIFGLPDIAAGDVLGSCLFNILIIPILDGLGGSLPISTRAHHGHILSAGFGILLLGLGGISIFAGVRVPSVGWMGLYSLLFITIYLLAMRMIFLHEKRHIAKLVKEMAEELQHQHISKSRAYTLFTLNALTIVGAATYLPHLGERIAEITGLGQTFVGSILIAVSTSLPEVVVSLAAVKIGAIDLAFGNIFGSNLFNLGVILAIDDILYAKGPLLSSISGNHISTAISAMTMTAIVIIGLTYKTTKKPLFLAWDSRGILGVYVINTFILYAVR